MKSLIPFIIRFSASFVAIFTNYIIAKHLGISVYGIYASMLSIVFLINIITDWGFNAYGSQMLAQLTTTTQKNDFVQKALHLKLFLSVIFGFSYMLFCITFFKQPLYYLLGTPIILFSFLHPEWVCRGLLLPHMASYRQIIFSGLNIVIFYLLYRFSLPQYLVFIGYAFNTILSFYIIVWILKDIISFNIFKGKTVFTLPSFGLVKNTSIYFYGYLANNINYVLGILMLTLFSNSSEVGVYASYYNIFTTLVAPIIITYGLFSPKVHVTKPNVFYTNYFLVISCILVAGIVFFVNGAFFYHLFYPKSFAFNGKTNIFAACVFVLYCLENLFVVSAILDSKPAIYFRSNAIALSVGIVFFSFFIVTKNLTAQTCFVCLISIQSTMCLASLVTYKNLIAFLNNRIIFGLFLVASILLLVNFLNVSIYFTHCLSFFLLMFIAFRIFKVLKHMY